MALKFLFYKSSVSLSQPLSADRLVEGAFNPNIPASTSSAWQLLSIGSLTKNILKI